MKKEFLVNDYTIINNKIVYREKRILNKIEVQVLLDVVKHMSKSIKQSVKNGILTIEVQEYVNDKNRVAVVEISKFIRLKKSEIDFITLELKT